MDALSETALQQLAIPLNEKIKLGGLEAALQNFEAIALIRALARKIQEGAQAPSELSEKDPG